MPGCAEVRQSPVQSKERRNLLTSFIKIPLRWYSRSATLRIARRNDRSEDAEQSKGLVTRQWKKDPLAFTSRTGAACFWAETTPLESLLLNGRNPRRINGFHWPIWQDARVPGGKSSNCVLAKEANLACGLAVVALLQRKTAPLTSVTGRSRVSHSAMKRLTACLKSGETYSGVPLKENVKMLMSGIQSYVSSGNMTNGELRGALPRPALCP